MNCRPPRTWSLLGLISLLVLLQGCGYSHQSLYPTDVQTVQVPAIENRSFYRGIEFELGEALIKEIELRTPYKVTQAATADTILRASVVRVEQRRLSRTRPGALPQEMELVMVIDFEWQSVRTGKTLRKREGLAAVGRYVPAIPVAEPYELAQHQAVQRAATVIVDTMRGDW